MKVQFWAQQHLVKLVGLCFDQAMQRAVSLVAPTAIDKTNGNRIVCPIKVRCWTRPGNLLVSRLLLDYRLQALEQSCLLWRGAQARRGFYLKVHRWCCYLKKRCPVKSLHHESRREDEWFGICGGLVQLGIATGVELLEVAQVCAASRY